MGWMNPDSTKRAIIEGFVFLLCLLILIWLIFILLYGSTGYPEILELKQEIQQLKEQNKSLVSDNALLWDETIYRKTEEYLEDVARKELGYGLKGERIVRWVNPDLIPILSQSPIQKRSVAPSPLATDEIQLAD